MKATDVSTASYEWSHGHKPKGAGHWGFRFTPTGPVKWATMAGMDENQSNLMTYTAARRVAVKHANAKGLPWVSVAP